MSGKSFLINRWRHNLATAWRVFPPAKGSQAVSPVGLELTWLTPSPRGGESKPPHDGYVVVDCAGETFHEAFGVLTRDRRLQGVSQHACLTALGLASAYVLVLSVADFFPAAEGAAARREDVEELASKERFRGSFQEIVTAIMVAKRRLRHEKASTFISKGIDDAEMKKEFREGGRVEAPIIVVFAQADRLEERDESSGFDDDPFRFARDQAPNLYWTVRNNFTRYRFDFASAFHGFVLDNLRDPTLRYQLPCYGAMGIFHWIDHLIAPQRSLADKLKGLPLGWALPHRATKLRRVVDPEFRRLDRQ